MKLRTIQVVNVRWFNATAWYGIHLARMLNDAGHETLTLALPGTDSFTKAAEMGLDPIALPLTTNNPLQILPLADRLSNIIADFGPDVVNCHRGELFFLFALLKHRHRFALVRTRGDQRLPQNTLPNRLLHQKAADAVIATNSAMARYFTGTLGIPDERVRTIYGGVDTGTFRFTAEGRAAFRREYGFSDDDFVIGLLGRLDAVKGQQELIQAAAAIARQGRPNIRLILIGFPMGTSLSDIKGWIAENDATSIVTVTGRVPDVASAISACDLGVVASRYSETIARAALEMMACGRPLVSTDVGVMPDLLPAEALCPPSNPDALAALLARVADNAAFRARLAEHATARMADLDYSHFLSHTLDAYRQALERAHR